MTFEEWMDQDGGVKYIEGFTEIETNRMLNMVGAGMYSAVWEKDEDDSWVLSFELTELGQQYLEEYPPKMVRKSLSSLEAS
jgi:hypothetical protein